MAKKPKSWLVFVGPYPREGRKTVGWLVQNKKGENLGYVQWNSGWRGYAFHPLGAPIFEQDCLRDIAEFVEKATKEHKENRP